MTKNWNPWVRRIFLALMANVSVGLYGAYGGDWPQFLGPRGDGTLPDAKILADWPASGPKVVWRHEVGEGLGAPVVASGRLVIFHRRGSKDIVECLAADTGKPVWMFDYPTSYRDGYGKGDGPRATPAIFEDKVYTYGAQGFLYCIDFKTGKKVWFVDTAKTFTPGRKYFGVGTSPTVEGKHLLMNIGGDGNAGVVAFEALTGDVVWKASGQPASYSTPIVTTVGGNRHALFFARKGLIDIDPKTGSVRYEFAWGAPGPTVNAATPVVIGDRVFLSTSYGTGATLLRIKDDGVEQLWKTNDSLTNHYATSVFHEGFLYGFHGRQERGPELRCIALEDAKVQWSSASGPAGSVLLLGDRLLVVYESGEIAVVAASPKAFKKESRAKVLSPTVRAYPAFANGFLYVRDRSTLLCLDVRPKE